MAWHHYRKACFDALVHCYIGIARACLLHKQGRSSKATDGGQFSTAKNAQLGHCKCDVNVCEPQNPPTYASGSRKSSIPYMLLCQQIPLHFQCLHPINVFSSPFALVLSALLRRSSETLISRLPVSWWVQSSLKCLAEQQKCISTTLRLDYHFYLV